MDVKGLIPYERRSNISCQDLLTKRKTSSLSRYYLHRLTQILKYVDNLKHKVTNIKVVERLKEENHYLKMDYNKIKKESHHNDQTLTQLRQTLTIREQTKLVLQQYTTENCLIVSELKKNEDTNGKIKDLARDKRAAV